jgi:hypothetical protein
MENPHKETMERTSDCNDPTASSEYGGWDLVFDARTIRLIGEARIANAAADKAVNPQ